MNKRIAEIRKANGLTQEKFGQKMGISKNYVNLIENEKKQPGDRLVSDICREFGIREEWLRTGSGEMYELIEDETAAIVSDLLEENNPFYDIILGIMKTYKKLDDKSQTVLQNLCKELLDNSKKND